MANVSVKNSTPSCCWGLELGRCGPDQHVPEKEEPLLIRLRGGIFRGLYPATSSGSKQNSDIGFRRAKISFGGNQFGSWLLLPPWGFYLIFLFCSQGHEGNALHWMLRGTLSSADSPIAVIYVRWRTDCIGSGGGFQISKKNSIFHGFYRRLCFFCRVVELC